LIGVNAVALGLSESSSRSEDCAMANLQTHPTPDVFETMIAWVRRMMAQSKRSNELRSVDRDMLVEIARDLNLSVSDLEVISSSDGRSDERLERQLATVGLSPEIIRLKYPDVMRDLRRVCSGCTASQSCDHAHQRDAASVAAIDCPNALTMQALQREIDTSEKPALPIGPCCC
jgi:hypothetical protein